MLDFIKLIDSSTLYNFHSHTQFCDGHATMSEFAAEAVRQGFSHYGFSPHSPTPFATPCNMSNDNVTAYFAEAERLKRLHASSPTRFYKAMEVDFLGTHWGPANSYFQDMGLDYMIGSVHFIPSQSGEMVDIDGHYESFRRKMADHFRNDIRYVVNTFYDQSMEMVRLGGFDIIGHYDKIGHNAGHYREGIEQEGWYRDRADELTEAIIASGVTVEINTKARQEHGRFFPATTFWKRLKESGAPVIINSDAHWPNLINASRAEAFDLYRNL